MVVTHGVALMAYLSDVLRLAPGQMRLLPYFTSVTVVRVNLDLDRRMVGSLVDATHLAGMDD